MRPCSDWPEGSDECEPLYDAFTLNTFRASLAELARLIEMRTGHNPFDLDSGDYLDSFCDSRATRHWGLLRRRKISQSCQNLLQNETKNFTNTVPLVNYHVNVRETHYNSGMKKRGDIGAYTRIYNTGANLSTRTNNVARKISKNSFLIHKSDFKHDLLDDNWPQVYSFESHSSLSKAKSEPQLELQLEPLDEPNEKKTIVLNDGLFKRENNNERSDKSGNNNNNKMSMESGFCDDILDDDHMLRVAKAVSQASKVAKRLRDRNTKLSHTLLPPLAPLSLLAPSRSSSRTSSSSTSTSSPTNTPRYAWRTLESQLLGLPRQQLQRQLLNVQRSILAKDMRALNNVEVADLTLSYKGVTALSLAASMGSVEVLVELIVQLNKRNQFLRALNTNSWLKSTSFSNRVHRETPLITVCRLGHLDICALLLMQEGVQDVLEHRDGNNCTALFNAVSNGHLEVAALLIQAGAKIFYGDNDSSCPLWHICRHRLDSLKGHQMMRLLVSHGANIEHVDLAQRSPLYWAIYNDKPSVAIFLICSGARLRRWSWLESDALPPMSRSNKTLKELCSSPMSLRTLARSRLRLWLVSLANGFSVANLVKALDVDEIVRAELKLWTLKMEEDT